MVHETGYYSWAAASSSSCVALTLNVKVIIGSRAGALV